MPTLSLTGAVRIGSDAGSRLDAGLSVTVIGMAVVFGVLIVLCGLMVMIGRFAGQPPAGRVSGISVDAAGSSASSASSAASSDVPAAPGPDEPAAGQPQDQGTPAPAAGCPLTAAGQSAHVVAAAVAAALVATMEGEPEAPAAPVWSPGQLAAMWRPQVGWAQAGRLELVTSRQRLPRG